METLAFNIAEKLLGRLASGAYQEISLALSVKVEVDKLKETLETITLVLQDAERKQKTNPLISHWLRKLNDVCYDADDVLDDFEYQRLRARVVSRGGMKEKVRNIFSRRNSLFFRYIIGHRMKDIRERLDEIAIEKNKYSLVAQNVGGDSQGVHNEVRDETYSHIEVSDVIGRDEEAKQIIGHLLMNGNSSEGEDHNISVISIVGFGGLGKTTLAKLVYNDKRVDGEFELKLWVCVSDEFVTKRLMAEIISLATGEKCDYSASLQKMQTELQKGLGGKKFLLVLDDVWDKEQVGVTMRKWDEFKTLLNVGGSGSKIIITTRNRSVATLTGSTHVQLEGLPHKDCMSLFKRAALIKKDEEQCDQQLMEIVEDIVKKCGGVPLALATVGGLLRFRRDLDYWLQVRDNEIWKEEDILPVLKLSYDALPSYLKPCFAYCSLFPKDYTFDSFYMVPMWMAHGYLHSSDGKQDLYEMGMDYIKQLCSRSLFQIPEEDGFIGMVTFGMHDLVHDLAISVAQVECSSLNYRPCGASERIRHISLSFKDLSDEEEQQEVRQSILRLDKVRTILLIQQELDERAIATSFFETCISKFISVRVLNLNTRHLQVLPNSIGYLSHLRYLNLISNDMEMLPDSICKLHNLQTLLLLDCTQLKELPKDIGNLTSLVTFFITTQQTYLPKGFKYLTSLRFLFFAECGNLKSLGEGIQCLTSLRRLIIVGCGSLESLSLSALKCLTQLETLNISYCKNIDLMEAGDGIPSLRSFHITALSLEALPNWLHDSANSLRLLHIGGCRNLSGLPEWIQDLKLLQKLVIEYCPKLLALPDGMHHLTALRELDISECPELIKRCQKGTGEDWAKIAHVKKITLEDSDVESVDDEDSELVDEKDMEFVVGAEDTASNTRD